MENKSNILSKIAPRKASQLLGLQFGNKIDILLGTGLIQKTLTYVYGKRANYLLNYLCVNAIHTFEGRAIFFDAGNSFDPYLMVRESNLKNNGQETAEDLLESIRLSRAFTCHQLVNLVTVQLKEIIASDSRINLIFVSGIDSVFSKEDSSKWEIEELQTCIASALREISSNKKNGIIYTVASSNNLCVELLDRSDTAIKLFQEGAKEKAMLSRHYNKQFSTIEL